MATVSVDRVKCVGLGVCESLAPDKFEVNDDGELVLFEDGTFSESERPSIEAAVQGCPVEALRIAEQ